MYPKLAGVQSTTASDQDTSSGPASNAAGARTVTSPPAEPMPSSRASRREAVDPVREWWTTSRWRATPTVLSAGDAAARHRGSLAHHRRPVGRLPPREPPVERPERRHPRRVELGVHAVPEQLHRLGAQL